MDNRHLRFLIVAGLFLCVYMVLLQAFGPQQQPGPVDEPAVAEQPDARQRVGDPDQGDIQLGERYPQRFHALGSLDPKTGFRLLVTLNSAGATLERAEFNGFKQLNDRAAYDSNARPYGAVGGYLGHLALADHNDGVEVRVVGAGTPAAAAGIQPGDIIQSVSGIAIEKPFMFDRVLRHETEAGQEIRVTLLRNGRTQSLPVLLIQPPLQGISPVGSDPLSLRTTLACYAPAEGPAADAARAALTELPVLAPELGQLDLFTANWQLLDGANGDRAEFVADLPGLGVRITKTYQLARAGEDAKAEPGYDLTVGLKIENTLEDKNLLLGYRMEGPNGLPTEGAWYVYKIGGFGMRDIAMAPPGQSPAIITTTEIAKQTDPKRYGRDQQFAYFGVDTPYFAGILIPHLDDTSDAPPQRLLEWQRAIKLSDPPRRIAKLVNTTVEMASVPHVVGPGEAIHDQYTLFLGPKAPQRVLAAYGLEDLVYYGWFPYLVKPLIWYLDTLYDFVGNFGLAIILLTITVRLLLFPLSRKQTIQMQTQQARMAKIQPEVNRLKERYKNDRQKLAQAQHELMLKHGVNPLAMAGGCLIIFLQLPIFVGLFNALRIDVELRDAPLFAGLPWAENLAGPDMLYFWQPWLPEFIVGPTGWLGPYFNLLPILATGMLYLQQKVLMPKATTPEQAMQQKMFGFMTIFFGFLFFTFPSGLCLYFIVSTMWGLTERKLLIPKVPDVDDPAGQVVKDSGKSPTPSGAVSKNEPSGGGLLAGWLGQKPNQDPGQEARRKNELRRKRSRGRQ